PEVGGRVELGRSRHGPARRQRGEGGRCAPRRPVRPDRGGLRRRAAAGGCPRAPSPPQAAPAPMEPPAAPPATAPPRRPGPSPSTSPVDPTTPPPSGGARRCLSANVLEGLAIDRALSIAR